MTKGRVVSKQQDRGSTRPLLAVPFNQQTQFIKKAQVRQTGIGTIPGSSLVNIAIPLDASLVESSVRIMFN